MVLSGDSSSIPREIPGQAGDDGAKVIKVRVPVASSWNSI